MVEVLKTLKVREDREGLVAEQSLMGSYMDYGEKIGTREQQKSI